MKWFGYFFLAVVAVSLENAFDNLIVNHLSPNDSKFPFSQMRAPSSCPEAYNPAIITKDRTIDSIIFLTHLFPKPSITSLKSASSLLSPSAENLNFRPFSEPRGS